MSANDRMAQYTVAVYTIVIVMLHHCHCPVSHVRSLRVTYGISRRDHVSNESVLSIQHRRLRWLGLAGRMHGHRLPRQLLVSCRSGHRTLVLPCLRCNDIACSDLRFVSENNVHAKIGIGGDPRLLSYAPSTAGSCKFIIKLWSLPPYLQQLTNDGGSSLDHLLQCLLSFRSFHCLATPQQLSKSTRQAETLRKPAKQQCSVGSLLAAHAKFN